MGGALKGSIELVGQELDRLRAENKRLREAGKDLANIVAEDVALDEESYKSEALARWDSLNPPEQGNG